MPLSEDDQRKFDEIEQALLDEDPVFPTTITIVQLRRRVARAAVAYFCAGIELLLTGLVSTQGSVALGVLIWAAALYVRRRPGP